MNLHTIHVELGYRWFLNKNSSLFIGWVHHSVTFTLNHCIHFIQCAKKQSPSILSSPSISVFSCSTLCILLSLDPDIQIYNINNVTDNLSYFEQQLLHEILNAFCVVFLSELLLCGLCLNCNIDHRLS